MIDLDKLQYGLRPLKAGNYLAVFGARAIFTHGQIEILHDRQDSQGDFDNREVLCKWLNQKAIPKLKEHIARNNWTQATSEVFTFNNWCCHMDASPNASYGYLYITAYLKGETTVPQGKWSGTDAIPKIGEEIHVSMNGIGPCKVLGYYLEDGWIGVLALALDPPEWYIKQNGQGMCCGLFGTEINRKDKKA